MHPYLRAYLAGIAFPTAVLPLVVLGLAVHSPSTHGFHTEDVIVFPMAIVPNAWGLWNALHVRACRQRDVPIGPFGAALVLVLAPVGYAIQLALGKTLWTPGLFAVGFPLTLAAYYLAWKHVVARLNDLLGIG
jgi:hypothetical protein